jgi:hypothetical protein
MRVLKLIWLIFLFPFCFCTNNSSAPEPTPNDSKKQVTADSSLKEKDQKDTVVATPKTYSNKRFKDVSVKKIGEHQFRITGKAQVFEASFSWVIEDGHNELKSGHQMTDAGAPEWGSFKFTVDAQKHRPNSTLTIVLFEASAKDGSRQYELPIPLEK